MKVTGIIAEYNPFHKGHAYHLKEARRITDADYLLVVMGGNFMQRGEPAIVDKFARARMALSGGADLVVELPSPFAAGSAEFFAEGAVELLDASGVVNALCFGSECGSLPLLSKAAELLLGEPLDYRTELKEGLKKGLSFPLAREKALAGRLSLSSEEGHQFFSSPNNILGIEYLKALKKRGSSIMPYTISRKGGYHADLFAKNGAGTGEEAFASASAIRRLLLTEPDSPKLKEQLPEFSLDILKNSPSFVTAEKFAPVLHYRLLSAKEPLEFSRYLDVSEDLSRRIFSLRNRFEGYDSFLDLLKTRQYTRTRIARCLLHILLDIKEEDTAPPAALRVLGFRKDSRELLTQIKKEGRIPLVTKLTDREAFEKEVFISSLYHLGTAYSEYSQPIVIL